MSVRPGDAPEGNDFVLDLAFLNAGGEFGEHIDHYLTISDSDANEIGGGGTTGRIDFDPADPPPTLFDPPDGPSLWWDFPFAAPVAQAAVYSQ
jgi:hypothetical protein